MGLWGRLNDRGDVVVLHEDGTACARIDVDGVYPVGSSLSTRYEHPDGIIITRADAARIGLSIER